MCCWFAIIKRVKLNLKLEAVIISTSHVRILVTWLITCSGDISLPDQLMNS